MASIFVEHSGLYMESGRPTLKGLKIGWECIKFALVDPDEIKQPFCEVAHAKGQCVLV